MDHSLQWLTVFVSHLGRSKVTTLHVWCMKNLYGVFTVAIYVLDIMLIITYRLGGQQVDEQVLIQRVGVVLGAVSVR